MNAHDTVRRRKDWESIAIPVVLMFTGLILLGGDRLGVLSLDRIQNLWPEALIVIGLIELMPYSQASRG